MKEREAKSGGKDIDLEPPEPASGTSPPQSKRRSRKLAEVDSRSHPPPDPTDHIGIDWTWGNPDAPLPAWLIRGEQSTTPNAFVRNSEQDLLLKERETAQDKGSTELPLPKGPALANGVVSKPDIKKPFSVLEFGLFTIFLLILAVCYFYSMIRLADTAQQQRLANTFFSHSDVVDNKVIIADQIYEFPLAVAQYYHWKFNSDDIVESPVVSALRNAKVITGDERFNSLWNFFHLTDLYDTRKSDEVFLSWLSLSNPHEAINSGGAFNDFLEKHNTVEKSTIEPATNTDTKGDTDVDFSASVEKANLNRLFDEVADRKMAAVDVYVREGRLIEAREIVARLANWMRAFNIKTDSGFESRANEIFVLEILTDDLDTILRNQQEFTDLYSYVRGLYWGDAPGGPWTIDEDSPSVGGTRYAAFRCPLQYISLMRATRLQLFAEAHERSNTLQSDVSCMKRPLFKEWADFGNYQALVADLLSRSCVTRPNSKTQEICDEQPSSTAAEYMRLRQSTLHAVDRITLHVNKNLRDDLQTMINAVRAARWNGKLSSTDMEGAGASASDDIITRSEYPALQVPTPSEDVAQ
ncbi:hypothetical protein [Rhizobium mesosinicum]|uniref:Uncharacterized protein n=1 Tax=Rhizobium mesosinicum TaxID=335017 RepID=A0ABS7GM41_9HYPH|nr:hypothetical protein [Rhizobium mesosinicum]MBW9051050.1 hypothetical protein [Rhizobium mesosinicum]